MSLLEELVRGRSLPKPNETTKIVPKQFQQILKKLDCLDENNDLITERFQQVINEDRFDIQILSNVFGRQGSDGNSLEEVLNNLE